MIRGRFDEQEQPTLPVKLTGPYGTIEVTLVVDTGFSSDVCIPMQIAIALGLPLKGHDFIELADGSITKEFVFQGNAQLGNLPPRDVDVYLTESEYGLSAREISEYEIGNRLWTPDSRPKTNKRGKGAVERLL